MLKKIGLFVLIAVAFVLVGCAKTTSDDIFRFEVRELSLEVGDTMEIGLVQGGLDENTAVIFFVENEGESDKKAEDVLKVPAGVSNTNEKFILEGLSEGTVRLTAQVKENSSYTDTIIVRVTKAKLTALQATASKTELLIGDKGSFTVKVYPNNLSNEVVYASSNSEVVSINDKGEYEALQIGEAVITITSKYDSSVVSKVTLKVNYNDATSVEVAEEEKTVILTETYQIVATVKPNEYPLLAENKVTYASSDEKVVTVNEAGLVTAKGVGEAVVTITSIDGKASKEVKITVVYAEVESISASEALTVKAGKDQTIKVTINPSNADPATELVFASSDANIATVDEAGKVSAVANGEVVITVSVKAKPEIKFEIKVTVEGFEVETPAN